MRLEYVQSVTGTRVITDSGMKIPLGNVHFKEGDPVWVEGNYVFGHKPERNSPVYIPNVVTTEDYLILFHVDTDPRCHALLVSSDGTAQFKEAFANINQIKGLYYIGSDIYKILWDGATITVIMNDEVIYTIPYSGSNIEEIVTYIDGTDIYIFAGMTLYRNSSVFIDYSSMYSVDDPSFGLSGSDLVQYLSPAEFVNQYTWSSSKTYATGDWVARISAGNTFVLWKSLRYGNIGHVPDSDDGTWWESHGSRVISNEKKSVSADISNGVIPSQSVRDSGFMHDGRPYAIAEYQKADTFAVHPVLEGSVLNDYFSNVTISNAIIAKIVGNSGTMLLQAQGEANIGAHYLISSTDYDGMIQFSTLLGDYSYPVYTEEGDKVFGWGRYWACDRGGYLQYDDDGVFEVKTSDGVTILENFYIVGEEGYMIAGKFNVITHDDDKVLILRCIGMRYNETLQIQCGWVNRQTNEFTLVWSYAFPHDYISGSNSNMYVLNTIRPKTDAKSTFAIL